jgi:hypothetical protein
MIVCDVCSNEIHRDLPEEFIQLRWSGGNPKNPIVILIAITLVGPSSVDVCNDCLLRAARHGEVVSQRAGIDDDGTIKGG